MCPAERLYYMLFFIDIIALSNVDKFASTYCTYDSLNFISVLYLSPYVTLKY